ncbi:tape measure protein [Brachybacterium sp. FME24]|uniref:tape measure protein n=1 Tax=Brachybacterium sp. FME24 TaxID=2742605 RepID=UPI001866C975|nr:tape measure protein [Brachybacterium sp. FME24]
MATGVELATAYVSIVSSTKGLGKDVAKELGQVEKDAEATGKNSGNRFSQAFGKWAKRGIAVGATAAGAVAGAALVAGMRSGIDQQQGQAVLSGLYGDAGKAQKTLQDLKKVSSRSPLDYSGYQSAAESLAYAGVEGESAIGVLENVGKVITAAGGDTQQLEQATGGVMKAVNNGGIAMMDSLGMISESGVPILSGLAEHFGVGIDEVKRMASQGEVNITDVMSVMENATGDTFQKMLVAGDAASETFSSQWKIAKDNVQVALGETLLPLIEKITPLIGPLGDALVDAVEKLPGFVDGLKDGIGWVKDNAVWLTTLATGLTVAGVAAWVASGGLTAAGLAIKGVFLAISTGIKSVPVIGWIIAGITLLVAALVWFFTQTEVGQKIWEQVWSAIKTAAGAVWDWISGTLWPGILTAWDAIAAGAVWLYENAIKPAWDGIKAAIDVVWGWIRDTLWPGLQAAWEAIGNAAKWLYESVIKPVWNGIKLAIAIAVTAVLVYIDLLKFWFESVIAPVFRWLYNSIVKPVWAAIQSAIKAVIDWVVNRGWPAFKLMIDMLANAMKWLYNNVIKPVWAAIQTAIDAVVKWFQNTAWPIVQKVIDWLKQYFEAFKNNLQRIWNFVKNNVINPVIAWFRDTAWPVIKRVIDRLKAGFQSMKDRLKVIWDSVKTNVIQPVANWLSDTLAPKIETVTDNIKSAFEVMKDGVKKAWDGIKSAARVPAKFVVEDVYNKTIRATFNGVAEKLGIDTRLPAAKVGFASGGVMPGYTPGRDVHQFYSPTAGRLDLSGGEAIMRPEFTRAVGGPAGVAALNMKARKGQAFAGGGVWGKIKGIGGDAWDWMKDKASTIGEALSDPLGVLTKLAGQAMDLVPGAGMVRELVQKAGTNAASQGGEWLKNRLLNSEVSSDAVPPAGKAGGGLGTAQSLARSFGLTMTSFRRGGARTAGSGATSLHALGRAMDFSNSGGPTPEMMGFFNAMFPYRPTELLYSPAGSRNLHRGGGMYANTGATKRNHYNHVHVGFKDGGVYDNGGLMEPGTAGINLTRKPEAVLDPRSTKAYQAHADSLASNDGRIELSATSIEALADALASRPNVVQIGSRQAGQLSMAGAQSRKSLGGR